MKRYASGILQPGVVRVLDGATGTELQRRGVRMSSQAWSGAAALEDVSILEDVHRDYIEAGADVITANTYSASRPLLELDGLGDAFEDINRAAINAAHRARRECARPDVLVAGSLSHRGVIVPGTATPDGGSGRSAEDVFPALREQAVLLREEGCDLIILEMMYDPALMPAVYAAAEESGLPTWVGFSARHGPDGQILGFNPETSVPFEAIVSSLRDWAVEAAGIMHTPSDLVSDALRHVRAVFDGPLIAYPDSGYFTSPNWEFEDIIDPEDLRRFAETWVSEGVQVVGGCCGLGPSHIRALSSLKRQSENRPELGNS